MGGWRWSDEKDDVHNHPQPGEDEAKVVNDGAEDGGATGAAFAAASARDLRHHLQQRIGFD